MSAKNLAILALFLGVLRSTPGLQGATKDRAESAGAGVVSWPAPAGEKLFEDYTLRVNGQAVPVYVCRVSAMPFNQVWPGYQRPLEQTELAGFAYWSMSGAVTVEMASKRPFQTVAIRPTSRGIQPTIQGQRIQFRLSRPGQFTVELDGPHHALHLFADPPEVGAPKPGDPNVLYFGPGVHRPGKIELKNGQTLYVAGGAVVYTEIAARGASGVRILGRGVIDSSEFKRGDGWGSVHLLDCSDATVDGVILRDPGEWCLSAFGCRHLTISRVKLIGLWRYNSDGIDICNSQDVTIRDSFVRSFDDSIVLKGVNWGHGSREEMYSERPVRNFRASNLVVWCDWGRALELGLETSAPEFADAVFRDIDIIRTTQIAIDIQDVDRAAIHDIRFDNIRVEVDDVNPLPLIQNHPGDTYNPTPDAPAGACAGCATRPAGTPYVPNLLVFIIYPHRLSRDPQRGTIRDVTFKDISVTGKPIMPSCFAGFDAQHDVRGVSIENLRFHGRPITSAADAHLQLGKYVQDVRFVESGSKQ